VRVGDRSARCIPADSRSIALAPVGIDGELDVSTPAREWNARVSPGRRRAHCSALRVRILEHLENSIASASIYSQVMKGLRWMPRRQEPMKDASGCEKLRGAAEIALIRRCPNGETRLGSCPVTRA
jgi:hypothetical protein